MKSRLGLLILLYLSTSLTNAAQFVAGDLAPRGVPDGILNAADMVVLSRLVNGLETPTATELVVADVGSVNAPDGLIDLRGMLILKRAVLGQITHPPIALNLLLLLPVTGTSLQG